MNSQHPYWVSQAEEAIKQGQSKTEFVSKCCPSNRAMARKAYKQAEDNFRLSPLGMAGITK